MNADCEMQRKDESTLERIAAAIYLELLRQLPGDLMGIEPEEDARHQKLVESMAAQAVCLAKPLASKLGPKTT